MYTATHVAIYKKMRGEQRRTKARKESRSASRSPPRWNARARSPIQERKAAGDRQYL